LGGKAKVLDCKAKAKAKAVNFEAKARNFGQGLGLTSLGLSRGLDLYCVGLVFPDPNPDGFISTNKTENRI